MATSPKRWERKAGSLQREAAQLDCRLLPLGCKSPSDCTEPPRLWHFAAVAGKLTCPQ